ncbi:H(+)/Cl(-) exchange transporter 7 [Drosophila guanche]|uniref:Chloride channel protein n=1 Tax=Drosophila guanche TaxID=7266 RepID=A0A3B0JLV5_DROGU|nr:H(+)/Cl(-) exchange transporter 7 [Drosophila guanche]SPP74226.1 blast:Paired amphipathic helix protein Sin3a [Drosophila guanche]
MVDAKASLICLDEETTSDVEPILTKVTKKSLPTPTTILADVLNNDVPTTSTGVGVGNNNSVTLKRAIDDDDVPALLDHTPSYSGNAINGNLPANDRDNAESEPIFRVRSRTAASSTPNYESLDYEVCENMLFQEEQRKSITERFSLRKDIIRWIIFIQIGIITALIACTIDIIIEELSELKYLFLMNSVESNVPKSDITGGDLVVPFLYWILLSVLPVAFGAAMVTYIEPITAGSGIPQVKSYLNGVKIPRIVRIKTLAVKAIGVITSVVGGLAGGKEGPMIHAGAVVAAGISQGKSTTFVKDFRVFKAFRDDHEKRDFVLGGGAAGVSAAFGAPIGGMLFSLEEAASFWNQNLIWRTLVASIISVFTLNIVLSTYHGLNDFTFTGLFNLGKFDQPLKFDYFELPIFMLLGVTGGLLGAAWNSLNTKINGFRKRYIPWKFGKVCEAVVVAMLGVTLACMMIYFINDCRPLGNDPTIHPVQLFCEDNEYNAVAALWFQTPEATVRSLFHDPPGSHKILTLAMFALVYYVLSCATFGLNVSLGVFIPTALVGAAWGRLLAMVTFYLFPETEFLHPGKYALIGAAANLGGVLRMTISLSVILMETTGVETSFFFPLIIALISAKWVGDYFNEGIYDTQIEVNHVPMLPWEPLPQYKGLRAREILSSPVVCIKLRDSAHYIYNVLKKCDHNGFPVVDDVKGVRRSEGRVCGIVLRSQLIVILLKSLYVENSHFWLPNTSIQTFRDVYPRYPSIKSVRKLDDKINYTVDLAMFMNPSPVRVNAHDSVPRIFQIFRALGLRHMLVINNENRIAGIITRRDFIYK